MLDAQGKQTGVPIKASSIEGAPTLAYLEKVFAQNRRNRTPRIERVKQTIQEVLNSPVASLNAFREALAAKRIDTQVSLKENGAPEAITFVDHETQCVCRDSDLGAYHSPAALQARIQYAALSRQADGRTKPVAQEKERNETTVLSGQGMVQKKHEISTSFRKENEPSFSLKRNVKKEQANTKEKEMHAKTEQREEKMEQSLELQKKRHRKNHLHL